MALIDEHPNICSLVGVVTIGEPKLVLVSLCSRGSLLDVLHSNAAGDDAAPAEKQQAIFRMRMVMASEIAAGMAHLSERHCIIHRDLAARNVLVDSMTVCKVADFGLSRGATALDCNDSHYYRSTSGIFPVRWAALETIASLLFSVASDVWVGARNISSIGCLLLFPSACNNNVLLCLPLCHTGAHRMCARKHVRLCTVAVYVCMHIRWHLVDSSAF